MNNVQKLAAVALVLMTTSIASAQSAPSTVQALSAWTNQSGSTLYIDSIDPAGKITGHYINRAAGYHCQNISYPVTGWVYGTAITFTTIWQSSTESCNSITAWTGFYYAGKISTLWQLVINGSTGTQQIIQGSDVFAPSTTTKRETLMRRK